MEAVKRRATQSIRAGHASRREPSASKARAGTAARPPTPTGIARPANAWIMSAGPVAARARPWVGARPLTTATVSTACTCAARPFRTAGVQPVRCASTKRAVWRRTVGCRTAASLMAAALQGTQTGKEQSWFRVAAVARRARKAWVGSWSRPSSSAAGGAKGLGFAPIPVDLRSSDPVLSFFARGKEASHAT